MTVRLDELIPTEELTRSERERLEHVHRLLVRAGPPPTLPRSLRRAHLPRRERTAGRLTPNVRRPRGPALLLAAALVSAVFAAGFLGRGIVNGSSHAPAAWSVPLRATAAASRGARALISAGAPDAGGNWTMLVAVTGLKPLPHSGYYVVYLVRHGRRLAPCGFFEVPRSGHTTVRFSVPYARTSSDAWVIAVHRYEDSGRTLLTT